MARASDPALARAAATSIVAALRGAGHIAYFAGGCVRDELLGLSPTDFDIATDAPPARVRALFDRTAEVGAAFGVVLVHQPAGPEGTGPRVSIEVATFRSDGPYSDARRPDTVRYSDPESDARRRDFTVNAMFLDPLAPAEADIPARGRVIDYVGGLTDLRAGVLRAVGDPDGRLAEDHLRALRAVRFTARLGFRLDPATGAAARRHTAELRGVSRERIGEELRRMLVHPARAGAMGLLQQLGLDAPVLMEPGRECPLPTLAGLGAGPVSPPVALAAWAIDRAGAARSGLGDEQIGQIARRWRGSLCLSNFEAEEFRAVLSGHQYMVRSWTAAGVASRKRWAAARWFPAAVTLAGISDPDLLAMIHQSVNMLQSDGVGIDPVPFVTGDDLVAAGLSPGPRFRWVLDGVYDAQLEGRVVDRGAAMELARGLYV